ncbi:unnamed protein product, partial [Phaeothamnion confervicola]
MTVRELERRRALIIKQIAALDVADGSRSELREQSSHQKDSFLLHRNKLTDRGEDACSQLFNLSDDNRDGRLDYLEWEAYAQALLGRKPSYGNGIGRNQWLTEMAAAGLTPSSDGTVGFAEFAEHRRRVEVERPGALEAALLAASCFGGGGGGAGSGDGILGSCSGSGTIDGGTGSLDGTGGGGVGSRRAGDELPPPLRAWRGAKKLFARAEAEEKAERERREGDAEDDANGGAGGGGSSRIVWMPGYVSRTEFQLLCADCGELISEPELEREWLRMRRHAAVLSALPARRKGASASRSLWQAKGGAAGTASGVGAAGGDWGGDRGLNRVHVTQFVSWFMSGRGRVLLKAGDACLVAAKMGGGRLLRDTAELVRRAGREAGALVRRGLLPGRLLRAARPDMANADVSIGVGGGGGGGGSGNDSDEARFSVNISFRPRLAGGAGMQPSQALPEGTGLSTVLTLNVADDCADEDVERLARAVDNILQLLFLPELQRLPAFQGVQVTSHPDGSNASGAGGSGPSRRRSSGSSSGGGGGRRVEVALYGGPSADINGWLKSLGVAARIGDFIGELTARFEYTPFPGGNFAASFSMTCQYCKGLMLILAEEALAASMSRLATTRAEEDAAAQNCAGDDDDGVDTGDSRGGRHDRSGGGGAGGGGGSAVAPAYGGGGAVGREGMTASGVAHARRATEAMHRFWQRTLGHFGSTRVFSWDARFTDVQQLWMALPWLHGVAPQPVKALLQHHLLIDRAVRWRKQLCCDFDQWAQEAAALEAEAAATAQATVTAESERAAATRLEGVGGWRRPATASGGTCGGSGHSGYGRPWSGGRLLTPASVANVATEGLRPASSGGGGGGSGAAGKG